eukprot:CAMPEP_0181223856 /NCGR_PEP_ID=MMETSP1096-20121128/30786_1 /TAXON_ID=156174 ORGANISM="Chrysochromulina ericina, Strain CCMP281" /NCGR_SAMPLE_ID=MMETSP1096 /ASSEMBLY_ACC=CAM_ASM_000453 /LENGTH=63 /DNA_ID=CAMNT_0023316839 /DNA_START=135 /DNA_END=326 /DNA_ORIENTATION=-
MGMCRASPCAYVQPPVAPHARAIEPDARRLQKRTGMDATGAQPQRQVRGTDMPPTTMCALAKC